MEPWPEQPVAQCMKWSPNREAGLSQLTSFAPAMGRRYAARRNHDEGTARQNVSQLSPWLHAGVLSEAEVLEAALDQHSAEAADKFVSEVFWRIYFKGYLEQRPSIWEAYVVQRDAACAAAQANSQLCEAYEQAVAGETGIAAFDHWARELVKTGYLHNHARMWFASIWIFTLKLDWTLGADFFLRHLIDGDAASNTLSWRWVGGLHTKGNTYLARASNIARYTENHPDGPLSAEGLASDAPPLTEPQEHVRQPPDLPAQTSAINQPYALLLHDEAASHVPLGLPSPPVLVISAARPETRSPQPVGDFARDFATQAVKYGGEEASTAFGCPHVRWDSDTPLASILEDTGIHHLAMPHLPIGWTRDALWPELAPLAENNQLTQLVSDLDRATWPHTKAGFFGVKKVMNRCMREAGVAARQLDLFDS